MTYTSTWRSPSNIALIKYWGKHGIQLPRNPSLSFTLSTCFTEMTVRVLPNASEPVLKVFYGGAPRPSFEPKIKTFFGVIADQFTWLNSAVIEIDSTNTFPHSAGIASSASAMSALALCLKDIDDQIGGVDAAQDASWYRHVSDLARLGSGSASRSVYPYAALWGKTSFVKDSSDHYAIPQEESIADYYKSFHDTILIVSKTEKAVSSTQGHALMDELPYASTRYEEAMRNLEELLQVMKDENGVERFISIVESEALQLHALMMSGQKPFILMEPGTIALIKEIWRFRRETGLPVCFTLDAGPNVHLLYPDKHHKAIQDWIKTTLSAFCVAGQYIADQVGQGPEKMAAN